MISFSNFGLALTLLLAACATPGPELQGHRGARGLAPENTLAGFDRAMALGVHTLELDTAVTRDGVVVISHDLRLNPNLTRDAQGRWLDAAGPTIASLSLAELQTFDVGRLKPGTRYAQTYSHQQPADGERIPTLEALFQRVRQRGPDTLRFNIETKLSPLEPQATLEPEAFVRALLGPIDRHGMRGRVSIQSFDWRSLRAVQRLAPGVPTVALTAQQSWTNNVADPRWTDGLRLVDHGGSVPRLVRAVGATVWSPYFGDLDAATLAEARALGLRVVVWTVNTEADIERLLDLGVDGIISDYPDRVRAALSRRRLPLPAAAL